MRNTVSLQQGCAMMFHDYPDVVDVPTMREMLGGIGRRAAYALLKSGEIENVKIGRIYRIPKLGVIAYLCNSSRAAEEEQNRKINRAKSRGNCPNGLE